MASKSRKSEPRVTQSLPKWRPKHAHSNFRKTVHLTKTLVFTMFWTHPDTASWCHVHSQIIKKTTLESALQFNGPYYETIIKIIPKLVPRGSQNPSKIFENLSLVPKESCWVSLGTSGSSKCCPRVPKCIPRISKYQIIQYNGKPKVRRHEASVREI